MRVLPLALICALVAACFSKPAFEGRGDGGGSDGTIDGPAIDPNAPALIATGDRHACRIAAGQVVCWGNNDHGQLGMRLEVADFTGNPGLASTTVGWTSVATGVQHTCGVRDGAVYCWGENYYRQSAPQIDRNPSITITPVTLPSANPVERVFAGGFATCAITTMHEAFCWGDLTFQLAEGLQAPLRLGDGTTTFNQIAIADDHACAIADGGLVHCWGKAEQGQTGRGDTSALTFAQARTIASTEQFTSLSAGHEATCGTTTSGKLVCWGSVNQGQLGDAAASNVGQPPLVVDEGPGWTTVAVGGLHTCAVKNGDVYCYGDDYLGALGSGTFRSDRTMGPKVEVGMQVSQLAANFSFTCALSSDGMTTKCWGSNSKGQLGNGEFSRKYAPTAAMLPDQDVAQLIAGDNHTCALVGATAPYTAYCWGLNHEQQLGTPMGTLRNTPVVASMSLFHKLAAGEKHTCGIIGDRTKIECWGENAESQLGSSSAIETRHQVTGTNWTELGAGSRMSCGIDAGDLICWGERPGDTSGVLPTPYPRLDINWLWHTIAVGSGFAVGVVLDGTAPHVAAIGSMAKRCAAGLVSTDNLNVPQQILSGMLPFTTIPMVSAAQAGGEHACVHRMAGATPTVSCMGSSNLPQVGGALMCGIANMNFFDVTSNWRTVSTVPSMFATADQTCALDANHRMKCWGNNSNLELGQFSGGSTPDAAFTNLAWPGQWSAIAGGDDHTCGIAMNRRVYCWGENQYGQVGDGTSYEPSPVVSGVYP
ncbi:MAG: regulator of chromosome condensation [Deltaproteobacteria bacterium]|nr:regulator of chromosome condensation [Deltaproteobacteria bacterium]